MHVANRTYRMISLLSMASVSGLVLAACGSSSPSSTGGQTLVIANFDPASGPNAAYAAFEQAGCVPAINLINQDGGVLGDKLTCQEVDDRGDPADAVPAAQNLLATTSNLVAVVDQNSGLLTATTPLFNAAHIPELSIGGDVPFDTNHYAYFWRTIPGDDVAGYALTAYLHYKTPYHSVAGMFTTDPSAQGNVPGLLGGVKNLHLTLAINEGLAIDQTSYETEIQRMLATHPDVMAMECDPQTAGVFYGQLKQAGGLLPGVLTSGTVGSDWDKAVEAAIGKADFQKYFVRVEQYAPSTGDAYDTFNNALMASSINDKPTYEGQIYSEDPYDNVNMIALAMLAAKSTNPATFNSFIPKIVSGATVVHTFAEGKTALAAGKTINYVGVEGQINFDQYHNSAGVWGVLQTVTDKVIDTITAEQVRSAEGNR
ncbi:MAG: ABC transporter substrate-binding protein [Candidatus Dormiibacterota bacterium]